MARHHFRPGPIFTCPCGYRGASLAERFGNDLLALTLFLVGIMPGLYAIFCTGIRCRCPRCRNVVKL